MTPEIKQRIEQIRNVEAPDGYKKTKYGIFPSHWKVDKLGNYLQELRDLSNEIEKYPVYSSSRKGLLPQSQYYDKREAVTTNLGYKKVPNGYVTYRHMSDDDIFRFNKNTTKGTVLVSSEYPVFNCNTNGNIDYILPLLNDSPRFKYYCRIQKMGGTRTRLYYKNLCQYTTAFPPLKEQQKIAKILSAQDKVIECYEKKIEQLKRMKKYYLQNMFPKHGETVPKNRFKGFTDPWKRRKLRDIFNSFVYGLNAAAIKYDGKHKYIRITDIDDITHQFLHNNLTSPDIDFSNADDYLLQDGDILFARTGASVGKTYIYRRNDGALYFAGFLIRAKIKSDYDAEFVFQNTLTYNYDNYIRMTSQRSGQPGVNAQEYGRFEISVPNFAEQQKIGTYFSLLDNIITLHQRKLEEEKKKKKALLQLLLTGIVRTN